MELEEGVAAPVQAAELPLPECDKENEDHNMRSESHEESVETVTTKETVDPSEVSPLDKYSKSEGKTAEPATAVADTKSEEMQPSPSAPDEVQEKSEITQTGQEDNTEMDWKKYYRRSNRAQSDVKYFQEAPKPKKKPERQYHDIMCYVCEGIDPILWCSGLCGRSFHADCLESLKTQPSFEDPPKVSDGEPREYSDKPTQSPEADRTPESLHSSPSTTTALANDNTFTEVDKLDASPVGAEDSTEIPVAPKSENGADAGEVETKDAQKKAESDSEGEEEIVPTFILCCECSQNRYRCILCNKTGPLGSKDTAILPERVFQCNLKSCNKFYHQKCLQEHLGNDSVDMTRLKCPAHTCRNCEDGSIHYTSKPYRNKDSRKLLPCFRCPVAYHQNCFPPGEDIDILGTQVLICHNHDPKVTFGKTRAELKAEYEARLALNASMVQLFPNWPEYSHIMWAPPETQADFLLPRSLLEAGRAWVPTEPPPYKKINRTIYHESVRKPPPVPASEIDICTCKPEDQCKEGCINASMNIECSKKCKLGDKCRNQRFAKREIAKVKVSLTKDRGWGLIAAEDIKSHTFIIEYCGELIDEDEKQRRLEVARLENEHNFYFFQLTSDLCIDAGPKGNNARFANHCCQPNCATQKWTVGSELRVGIFSLVDIPAGTEITYDYNFEGYWAPGAQIACKCGAPNCSKFLGKR